MRSTKNLHPTSFRGIFYCLSYLAPLDWQRGYR
nr:MAG TPA_asm: hypothetical protein [Caudoviricetes sp.]